MINKLLWYICFMLEIFMGDVLRETLTLVAKYFSQKDGFIVK